MSFKFAPPVTYNLDENSAALLLKAKSSSATPTARGVHQQSQAQAQSTANGLIFGMCIAAFFVVVASKWIAPSGGRPIKGSTELLYNTAFIYS